MSRYRRKPGLALLAALAAAVPAAAQTKVAPVELSVPAPGGAAAAASVVGAPGANGGVLLSNLPAGFAAVGAAPMAAPVPQTPGSLSAAALPVPAAAAVSASPATPAAPASKAPAPQVAPPATPVVAADATVNAASDGEAAKDAPAEAADAVGRARFDGAAAAEADAGPVVVPEIPAEFLAHDAKSWQAWERPLALAFVEARAQNVTLSPELASMAIALRADPAMPAPRVVGSRVAVARQLTKRLQSAGLSPADFAALPVAERIKRLEETRSTMHLDLAMAGAVLLKAADAAAKRGDAEAAGTASSRITLLLLARSDAMDRGLAESLAAARDRAHAAASGKAVEVPAPAAEGDAAKDQTKDPAAPKPDADRKKAEAAADVALKAKAEKTAKTAQGLIKNGIMGLVSAGGMFALSKFVTFGWLTTALHLLPFSLGMSAVMLAAGLFLRWRARRPAP